MQTSAFFGMPLGCPPNSELRFSGRFDTLQELSSFDSFRRSAICWLIEHGRDIPDDDALTIIVLSASAASQLLLIAALHPPGADELLVHFEHFVLSCVLGPAESAVL